MVLRLTPRSPGDHRFVDPVIRATRWHLANLTPASGRQNHTASPSAHNALVSRAARVHRIPPNGRDDRDRPSWQGRMARAKHIFPKNGSKIFFAQGLDMNSRTLPVGQITR